jgi:hypothetical protein
MLTHHHPLCDYHHVLIMLGSSFEVTAMRLLRLTVPHKILKADRARQTLWQCFKIVYMIPAMYAQQTLFWKKSKQYHVQKDLLTAGHLGNLVKRRNKRKKAIFFPNILFPNNFYKQK